MFSWFRDFWQTPQYYQYPDTFGFRQKAVDQAICQAIQARQKQGDLLLLVCHFQRTFSNLVQMLERHNIECQIETQPIDARWLDEQLEDVGQDREAAVFPVLSQRLDPHSLASMAPQNHAGKKPTRQLSAIVIERHPKSEVDQRVQLFAEYAVAPARVGYYLCLEDPLIRHCFGEMEQQLLKNWNSADDHVFGSSLASGRIRNVIKRRFAQAQLVPEAESVQEWFAANNIELNNQAT